MNAARTHSLEPVIWLSLLALSLVPFFADFYPHDAQRIAWTVIMASMGIIGVIVGIRPTRTEWAVLIVTLIVGTASALMAKSTTFALIETLSWLAMLVGVIVLSRMPFTRQALHGYMMVIALISVIYYLRFVVGYAAALIEESPLYPDHLIDGFSNRRFHSQFQTWTLPLLMTAAVLTSNRRARGLWLLAATLGWGLLFFAGTRATLLGLLVSTIVVVWLFREYARNYLTTFLLSAVGGALLFTLIVFWLPAIFGLDNDALSSWSIERNFIDSSGRTQLWLNSLSMAFMHPWLGAGPMHFACDSSLNYSAHPHNLWLQFLSEWGIPFTIAITVGFIYLVIRWVAKVQTTRVEDKNLALPITVSLSTALAHSLFDGIAVMPLSQFYGVMLFSWALSWYRGVGSQPAIMRMKSFSLALPGLILLGFVAVSLPGLSDREDAELLLGPAYFQPRFWIQGKICLDSPTEERNINEGSPRSPSRAE